ncbi:MAG: SDR family NAD(P)-dependent oxidoreductase [Planctomycetota bacterium]
MNLDLTGRTALVTGGATGIGLGIARQLLDQGAAVVLASRSAEALAQARETLGAPERIRVELCDIGDAAACAALIRTLAQPHPAGGGRLDILINNAGVDLLSPLSAARIEAIDAAVRTNLCGALYLTRAAIPLMTKGKSGGAILSIASAAALRGAVGRAVYAATKAALIGLTRSLAVELAPRNIRVNAVAPGVVNTELNARAMAQLDADRAAAIAAQHPLGLGEVADVAQLCGFLVSPAARWITGQTVAVDGGLSA